MSVNTTTVTFIDTLKLQITQGRGTFNSTKNFRNFGTGVNGTEIFPEGLLEKPKLLIHSTKSSGNSGNKIEWNGNLGKRTS